MPEPAEATTGPYERWNEVVLPLLLYIGQHESDLRENEYFTEQLAQKAGLSDRSDEVFEELRRLVDDGYVACERAPRGARYLGLRLTGKGARAIKMWPPNDLVAALQSYIDQQIAQAKTEEERLPWERFKQAIAGLTPPLVTAAIQAAVSVLA